MKNKQTSEKLETYLSELEKSLEGISVSEKSEILMEIHSHIQDRLSQPGTEIEGVLISLGSPTTVANRFRLERGLSLARPKKGNFLKWFAISLGVLILVFCVSIFLLVKSFFPLVDVNEKEKRVSILGGMIEITDDHVSIGHGSLKIDGGIQISSDGSKGVNVSVNAPKGQTVKGTYDIQNAETFKVLTQSGHTSFQPNKDSTKITYDCFFRGQHSLDEFESLMQRQDKALIFEVNSQISKSKCHFNVPESLKLDISQRRGMIELENISQDVSAKLHNGMILFRPQNFSEYMVNASVKRGSVTLPHSNQKGEKRYTADLSVDNGSIASHP